MKFWYHYAIIMVIISALGGISLPYSANAARQAQQTLSTLPADALPAVARAMIDTFPATYQIRTVAGEYQAENPAHGLHITFTPEQVHFTLSDPTKWWAWQLTGLGDKIIRPAPASALVAQENRLEYQRDDGLTEWYLNTPLGLEQGFTVSHRPAGGSESTPLQIVLTVTGTVTPQILDRQTLAWVDAQGQAVAQYTGLLAFDAAGHTLPAWLETQADIVRLCVDDRTAVYPLVIDPWVQQAKVTALGGTAHGSFGMAVALSGDTAIVGASGADGNKGAAYIFVHSNGVWTQQARLTASDGAINDYFGIDVALNGDTALIAAHQADINGHSAQGAVYVFVRSGVTWTQQTKLTAGDGGDIDYFGTAIAFNGDTALIGAVRAEVSGQTNGAAYVFVRSGADWTQQAKLTASDGAAIDEFGRDVALSGDTAVVAASKADAGGRADQGAAYVFVRSGATWTQQAKLTASDGTTGDSLSSVALNASGNLALIGAYLADVNSQSDQGAAYTFSRSGATWTQQAKLTASDGAPGDWFGIDVFLNDATIMIGATHASINGHAQQGAVYVFGSDIGLYPWRQYAKLTSSDGTGEDLFGSAVALDGNLALIGAVWADFSGIERQGLAYTFESSGGGIGIFPTWNQQTSFVPGDGAANDQFGTAVAVSGNILLVGARYASKTYQHQGLAYVFLRNGARWDLQARLMANDGKADDYFGWAVALNGNTALIGAPHADISGALTQGAVYIFTRSGVAWTEQPKLTASDGAAGDEFGIALALTADTAIVGAPGADIAGHDSQGAAYVFVNSSGNWTSQQKLFAGDGAASDRFGEAVALYGNRALVGAPDTTNNGRIWAGSAYGFTRSGGAWTEVWELAGYAAADYFGTAVAVSDSLALVGASGENTNGQTNQGAVYAYQLPAAGGWQSDGKLTAANGAAQDNFGSAIALSGTTALIGNARFAPGAVYVFSRASGVWAQQQKLTVSDGMTEDYFGSAVALSSDTAVIGASGLTINGNTSQGAVYVFTLPANAYLLWTK